MQINLPEAGWNFLQNFSGSPLLYFLLLLVLLVTLLTKREKSSLWAAPRRLPLPAWTLLIPGFIWLTGDLFIGLQNWSETSYLYIFIRDGLVYFSICPLIFYFSPAGNNFQQLFGRLKPTGKLLLLGLGTFFFLGLFFWGLAFIIPYSVNLSRNSLSLVSLIQGLLIILLIPLWEELIFRNYAYRLLRNKLGLVIALLSLPLIFSLLHGLSLKTPFIFAGALLMTALFEFTGSILPGLVIHAGFNFLITWGHLWL